MAKDLATFISSRLKEQYFEPFLGSGSVFFRLRPQKSLLSDINSDLINVYRQVRKDYKLIIEQLKNIPVTKQKYYEIRDQEPIDLFERAVRFLYLNRTAFGGIYRLNQDGKFNVPFGGGQRTPAPLWERQLLETASESLRNVNLLVSDFQSVIDQAEAGDVVYCDPTYTVVHNNNNFIRYNERNFSWSDQQRLAIAAKKAYDRGVVVIISNANHSSVFNLYSPFQPIVLNRKSLVSRKVESRRDVSEFLYVLDPLYKP